MKCKEFLKRGGRGLVLRGAGEAADGEAPEEDAAEDGHEVADVHGHDCQHAVGTVSLLPGYTDMRARG